MESTKLKRCPNCYSKHFEVQSFTMYTLKRGILECHGTKQISEILICSQCSKQFDFAMFQLEDS